MLMKIRLFALLLAAVPAFSQNGIKEAMVKHWKSTADLTIAVAKAMPAESYNFRPNPEEMNFGQLMAHIAGANVGACGRASGMPRPAIPEKILSWSKDQNKIDVDRDVAIQFLTDTFAFCGKAVESMTPEKLNATLPGNPAMTGFETLWAYFTHTAHHRGQAEVYLRVKGIKPPEYVF
jgi:uncharacterized damage-inducible protein DinB